MCQIPENSSALPPCADAIHAGRVGAAAAMEAYRELQSLGQNEKRMRDLTWPFTTQFPALVDELKPVRSTWSTREQDKFFIQEWTLREHTGTHVDAPIHFVEGGRTSPELRMDELMLPGVVIDISERVAEDPGALLSVDDLERFEHAYGRIPRRSLVMMYTGWESRASSNDAYVGLQEGNADVLVGSGAHIFPGFSLEALDWLLDRRDITSVGVDVVSIDGGAHTDDGTFPVHEKLLSSDKYAIENLRNHGTIPPIGSEIFVGLIPFEGGSGGICRVMSRW